MWFLVDEHGESLGQFDNEQAAVQALGKLIAEDPAARDKCGIVFVDHTTRNVYSLDRGL